MRLMLLIISLLIPFPVLGQKYVVVTSVKTEIESLDAHTIKDIFLMKRKFSGSVRVFPVNLLGSTPIRSNFEDVILNMDREELNQYWVKNHFQGISPPSTQASLQSIKLFVEKVDGALGYLPSNMLDDNLKVLYEF